MMYTVFFFALLTLLALFIIVGFVVNNIGMFQTPFDIVVGMSSWKHTWEDVPFIYLIGGSFLLGMTIIVISVVIFDAKLKLKIRALRKEVKQLEQAVKETKSMLPQPEVGMPPKSFSDTLEEQTDITPEDVAKSFEDTVQSGDFPNEPDVTVSSETPQDAAEMPLSQNEPEKKNEEELPKNIEVSTPEQRQNTENADS
ncbi:hypothetical protein U14_04943 [Candidatus Moduliflexus flocculans]|uniref:Lipopolysaccharide assembly protein A domain-containing protein n=1 Tax=Candidatus Moduliflexus flocculans TaxID=1499966 RepID=A0A0S6W5E5_9BACT|nr:hypothetical protein U14_04943 [Candidatus Moduliflexus flocculans]